MATDLEDKYKGYKGADTDIVILVKDIAVPVGDECSGYGVDGVHEVLTLIDDDGNEEEIHVVAAVAPKALAEEMVKAKRAHLRKKLNIKKAEDEGSSD